jgi:hypothetical protein
VIVHRGDKQSEIRTGRLKEMLPKDPEILFGFINMKLRDFYHSLEELCEDLNVERQDIMDRLGEAGYHYNKEKNRFE